MIQVDLQNIRSFIPLPYEAALSPRLRQSDRHELFLHAGHALSGRYAV